MKRLKNHRLGKEISIISIITFLLLIVLVLIVDGVAYFILDIKVPGYKPERFFEYNALTGQFHKPNTQGFWYRYKDGTKYFVKINNFGFSDQERSFEKTKPRIAILGDSTAEFWEADIADRGHTLMEEKLKGNFEVLNFGVRGFGTDQTYLLFKEKVIKFSPDIVILNFCINDFWDNYSRNQKPYFELNPTEKFGLKLMGVPVPQITTKPEGGLKYFLWNNSFFLRRFGLINHPLIKPFYPLSEHFELRPYKKKYDQLDNEIMNITKNLLLQFNDDLKKNGTRLIVVEVIYKPVMTADGQKEFIRLYGDQFDFNKATDFLEELCKSNDIEFISLSKEVKKRNIDVNQLMHKEDTLHLNKEGIALYVNSILESLNKLKWLEHETKK